MQMILYFLDDITHVCDMFEKYDKNNSFSDQVTKIPIFNTLTIFIN